MFRDRSGDFSAAHFIEADFLSEDNPELNALKGKMDIVSCLQVIHQWDWDGQVKGAKTLATFIKGVGGKIVGNNIGNPTAQSIALKPLMVPMYRQNPESFKKLWDQVGEETGTKWEVQAWMRSFIDMQFDPKDAAWMEDGVGIIEYAVERVQ